MPRRAGRAIAAGALAWILGLQFFLAQALVQHAWTRPFSLRLNYISDLGNTTCAPFLVGSELRDVCSPLHAWMNASFVLLGLTILAGAVLARAAFPPGRLVTAGLLLVASAGPGLVVVGLSPEDVNLTLHKVGAGVQFIGGNAGLVLLGCALASRPRWRAPALWSLLSGATGLLATAAFIVDFHPGLGIGGMERLAVYPLPLALSALGLVLLRDPAGLRAD